MEVLIVKKLYHPGKNKTIGSAFRAYSGELARLVQLGQASANATSLARTALLGYTVPAWGGPTRQSQRMTPVEVKAALEFLDSLPLERLGQAVATQEQYFEEKKIHAQIKKANRYQLVRFITWVEDQGWLTAEPVEDPQQTGEPKSKLYRHSFNLAHQQGKESLKTLTLTNRERRPNFGLKPEQMNEQLTAQMEALAQFEATYLDHRPATITSNKSFLLRMLGWLFHYCQVPLADLSLASLVPYTPLKVSMEAVQADCPNEDEVLQKYLVRCQQRKTIAEQQAQAVERLLEDYFIFYQGAHQTQSATVQALLIVAKYFYRQDTDNTASKSGYTDIPVVRRLRQKLTVVSRAAKRQPKEIPYAARSISWEKVLEVLKQQQAKYEERFYHGEHEIKGKVYQQKTPRRPSAIAVDLQLLLVLCFFTVIPPMRNRTICELEIGRTLVRGGLEDGVFIPAENMARPELAQWHLHLEPEDYKTGKVYGQYHTPIEDVELAGGTMFYSLLQTWIDVYRPLFKPAHNQLFVKTRETMGATPGEPITHRNLTSWVKYVFYRHTGVPVVPQSLRKMYVTHLKNSGASEAQLEAAARAMMHSRAMQTTEYDQQDLRDKVAPIAAYNRQLFQHKFQMQEARELPLTSEGELRVQALSDAQLKVMRQQLQLEHKRRQQEKAL